LIALQKHGDISILRDRDMNPLIYRNGIPTEEHAEIGKALY